MALQVDFSYHNLVIPAAYLRVLDPQLRRSGPEFYLAVYASAQARQEDDGHPVATLGFAPTGDLAAFFSDVALKADGHSPLERCYAYLKTLPDYAGALDV